MKLLGQHKGLIELTLHTILGSGQEWVLDQVMDYVSRMRSKCNFNHPMSYASPLQYFEMMRREFLIWDEEAKDSERTCPMKALRNLDGSIVYSHFIDGFVVPVPKEPRKKIEEGIQEMIDWATELEKVAKEKGAYWHREVKKPD